MKQRIGYVSVVVRDYDEAIAYYTGVLGFRLVADIPLAPEKRWVLVAPAGASECALLLARAASPEQDQAIGRQAGGRVFLFLHTDDFWRDYRAFVARGVRFCEAPRTERYGTVAVFADCYGNRWDLLQLIDEPPAIADAEGDLDEASLLDDAAGTATDSPAAATVVSSARVVEILIAASPAEPAVSVPSATAVPGVGLEGDRYARGVGTFSRHPQVPDGELTLVQLEHIQEFATKSGVALTTRDARRNLVTVGVDLNALVGCDVRIGEVLIRGIRLCEPCNYLAKQTRPEVLKGLVHKGGLRAQILTAGVIRLNDPIVVQPPGDLQPPLRLSHEESSA